MSRHCEHFPADFCASALLKALKINSFNLKKADGQAFRSADVQKSGKEFSHGLNFRVFISAETFNQFIY